MTFYISKHTKTKVAKSSGYPVAGILGEIERRNMRLFDYQIMVREADKLTNLYRAANVLIVGDTSVAVLKHCEDYEVYFINPETLMITGCI